MGDAERIKELEAEVERLTRERDNAREQIEKQARLYIRLEQKAVDRAEKAEAVVRAAGEWVKAHEWAEQNPSKMLSSRMTTDEAAEVMETYFLKEKALKEAYATFRGRV